MTDTRGEHYIRPYDINGEVTSDDVRLEQIRDRMRQLNPDAVGEVGSAYLAAAAALATAARRLEAHAESLAGRWRGTTATKALEQMGKLNTTAVELANKSRDTGDPLRWLSTTILPWFRQTGSDLDHGTRVHVGPVDAGREDGQARELMDRLNNRLAEAHNALPERVTKDLPPPPRPAEGELGRTGPPGGGMPGGVPGPGGLPDGPGNYPGPGDPFSSDPFDGDVPPGPGDRPPGGLPDGPGEYPGPDGPFDPAPHPGGGGGGTDLAGLPDGGATGGGMGAYGGGGTGTGGFAGGPGGYGGGAGAGPGGMGAGLPVGAGGTGSAAGTAGRPGMGMPMGGHGGQDGEERERGTWLTEDDDVWGVDKDLPPPVIG